MPPSVADRRGLLPCDGLRVGNGLRAEMSRPGCWYSDSFGRRFRPDKAFPKKAEYQRSNFQRFANIATNICLLAGIRIRHRHIEGNTPKMKQPSTTIAAVFAATESCHLSRCQRREDRQGRPALLHTPTLSHPLSKAARQRWGPRARGSTHVSHVLPSMENPERFPAGRIRGRTARTTCTTCKAMITQKHWE